MNFEKLLENPEKYRCGKNYRASNIVFPVEYEGRKYTLKKPRNTFFSSLIERYYSFQSGSLNLNQSTNHLNCNLNREAGVLEELNGLQAPRLFHFDFERSLLIREYLEGKDFRELSNDGEIGYTLEGALDAMVEIHQKEIFIGDAHVKNVVLSNRGNVCWLDFDRFFDTEISSGKSTDLIKFVYSTFTAARDEEAIIYAAKLVAKNYPSGEVKDQLRNKVKLLPEKGFKLWFPTRLPTDGRLNQIVKKILES